MTFIIGLTGGAACGKSTASALFKELGVPIVDADAVSHALTERGGAAIPVIESAFGEAFIHEGALNRTRMRELVFRDPAARLNLEAILHPMIGEEIQRRLASIEAPYAILDAALLVENAKWRTHVNRLLVIDVPEKLQLQRLLRRQGLTESIARGIIKAQASREHRLSLADDVIENSGTLQSLQAKVCALHQRYLALASSHEPR